MFWRNAVRKKFGSIHISMLTASSVCIVTRPKRVRRAQQSEGHDNMCAYTSIHSHTSVSHLGYISSTCQPTRRLTDHVRNEGRIAKRLGALSLEHRQREVRQSLENVAFKAPRLVVRRHGKPNSLCMHVLVSACVVPYLRNAYHIPSVVSTHIPRSLDTHKLTRPDVIQLWLLAACVLHAPTTYICSTRAPCTHTLKETHDVIAYKITGCKENAFGLGALSCETSYTRSTS
jgi:hypothetical protein